MTVIVRSVVLVAFALLASGCVSVIQPVAFSSPPPENAKVGIVLVEAPEAAAQYTGSIGLLDLAIISGANSGLNAHLKTLTFDDYATLPAQLEEVLDARGLDAVVIDRVLTTAEAKKLKLKNHKDGVSRNNYSMFKTTYDVDYLLILRMYAIGTTRPYYGPVPTAAPLANASIWGELVDLNTQSVLWYRTTTKTGVIPEPWKEKELAFPNLTNAVYTALNDAIESIKVDLGNPEADKVTASEPVLD